MNSKRTAAIYLAVMASLLATGLACEQQQNEMSAGGQDKKLQQKPGLYPQTKPPIPDVPLPMGFSMDEGRSRSFAAAGARYIDHVYKGRADKFELARFYKEYMPKNRWTLVTDMFVRGDVVMDFEKQTERCRVVVSGGGFLRHTYINVQLWTSGRIPTQAAQKK